MQPDVEVIHFLRFFITRERISTSISLTIGSVSSLAGLCITDIYVIASPFATHFLYNLHRQTESDAEEPCMSTGWLKTANQSKFILCHQHH